MPMAMVMAKGYGNSHGHGNEHGRDLNDDLGHMAWPLLGQGLGLRDRALARALVRRCLALPGPATWLVTASPKSPPANSRPRERAWASPDMLWSVWNSQRDKAMANACPTVIQRRWMGSVSRKNGNFEMTYSCFEHESSWGLSNWQNI